jgi:hypothetical protein
VVYCQNLGINNFQKSKKECIDACRFSVKPILKTYLNDDNSLVAIKIMRWYVQLALVGTNGNLDNFHGFEFPIIFRLLRSLFLLSL